MLKLIALRALLIAAVLAIAACDSAEDRAERHFQRGVTLLNADETAKARLEFRNALRLDKEHLGAQFELAKLNEEGGNFRAAYGGYQRVIEGDPGHVEARLRASKIALAGGEIQQARLHIEAAVIAAPDNAEVLAARALISYQLGDVDSALLDARAALERDPASITAHLLIIRDLREREGDAPALAALDALIERFPAEDALNFAKLQFLVAVADAEGLEAHLRRMVERKPEAVELRKALAEVLRRRGAIDLAEVELRAITVIKPADTAAALDVVRFLASDVSREAAGAELVRLIEATSDAAEAAEYRIALSALQRLQGDRAAARATLTTVVQSGAVPDVADRARLELARMALEDADAAGARALVDTVLDRDADNVAAIALRASLLIDALELDEAILGIRRGLGLDPRNVQLLLLEALAQERLGNISAVGERLAAAARASEFAPEVALRYAAHLNARGQQNSAATALEEALRRHPSDRRLLASLADLRLRMGDVTAAEAIAARLRTLNAEDTLPDRIAIASLNREGRLGESIPLLERLVREDTAGGDTLANLVAAYVAANEAEKARTLLDQLIADNPLNLRALALRAELHVRAGETDAAFGRLADLIAAAPERPAGYLLIARLHTALGRMEDAERATQEGLTATNGNVTLRLQMASLLETRGDFENAIAEYRMIYAINPDSVVAANNLASLLAEFRSDQPEELAFARSVARRFRESTVPHFLDTYGWIAFLSGDTDEALRTLRMAAEALPDNPIVRYHLGRAYAAAGERTQARAELEAALALSPTFPKAASAREVLAELGNSGG